jgi:hypothetical protein
MYKAVRLSTEQHGKRLWFPQSREDLHGFGSLDKTVVLSPGYASQRVDSWEIDAAMPRRALILGTAIWLAKQMNLIEFIAAADELFYQQRIELWVVGNVSAQLRSDKHFRATRHHRWSRIRPIFATSGGIVAERTGGGFKLKTLDYIFNRVPIAAIREGIAGLPLTPEIICRSIYASSLKASLR